MDYRRAFRAAAVSFADLVARVPGDRLDGPGLGDWTLRELAGHTVSSGLRQVPRVLATPDDTIARATSEEYWLLARTVAPEVLAAATAASSVDARATGLELGDDPAG